MKLWLNDITIIYNIIQHYTIQCLVEHLIQEMYGASNEIQNNETQYSAVQFLYHVMQIFINVLGSET